jgi:uncharacterized membrane protein
VRKQMKTIIGAFADRTHAESAIHQLQSQGFEPSDISVVMKDQRESQEMADDTGVSVAEGTVSGATTGVILGGITGLLAGTVLPGLGVLLIGGPLATALGLSGAAATTVSGAATGALAGGLIGALTGLGLSEEEAKTYEQHVKEGAILLAVPTPNHLQTDVETIFTQNQVSDMTAVGQSNQSNVSDYSDEVEDVRFYQDRPAYATVGTKGGRTKKQEDVDKKPLFDPKTGKRIEIKRNR